jgi:CubicO group peptidase (beta-lactamase class C family)
MADTSGRADTRRRLEAEIAGLLETAIASRVTPAAVVEAGTGAGPVLQIARGRLTYDADAAAARLDSVFDLASLTKVIATTTLAMRACETGALALDRIAPLLDHSSGAPAHVPLYERHRGRADFEAAIAALPPAYAPGSQSLYSDVGFMSLGFLLEDALGAPLDAAFAPLASRLGAIEYRRDGKGALPLDVTAGIAPTEIDPWRGRLLSGEVHDENAFALDGVAGHAGLFGDAAAVGAFARAVLATFRADTWLARTATVRRFAERSRVPGSSRALGWDTMLPTSSCGTRMSAEAIGHTGFTGTSLWIDPRADVYVVLLTNRVHPTRHGEGIQPLRRSVADAVTATLGA